MAFLRATALLFQAQLLGVLRAKRALVCAVLACIPIAFALFVAHVSTTIGETPRAADILWNAIVQVMVPLVALILGSAVVAGEIEDRTVTYLFTRPIPRASVLIGRWIATLVVIVAILLPSAALTLLILDKGLPFGMPAPVPGEVARPLLLAVCLGSAVYSGVFAAIGTFLKHPMIVGLGYVFAVEVFLTNLPGSSQELTLQFYLRSYVASLSPEHWLDVTNFAGTELEPGGEALRTLLWTLGLSLVGGSAIVTRKQYVLSS